MTAIKRVACAGLLIALFGQARAQDVTGSPEERKALVIIWSKVAHGDSEFGTGFFFSPDGRILTCYHVIRGATSLEVYDGSRYHPVVIERISPRNDLAILRVTGKEKSFPYLRLSRDLPKGRGNERLHALGHAAGIPTQQFDARMTRPDYVLSREIRAPGRGQEIFRLDDVKLITLDMTIYGGLSGGPLVSADGVIGVVSGSLTEGGSIAWAIPVLYADEAHTTGVGKTAQELRDWPELELMARNWRSLKVASPVRAKYADRLSKLYREIDRLEDAVPGMTTAAAVAAQKFRLYEAALARMQKDGKPDPAQIDAHRQDMAADEEKYEEASRRLGESFAATQSAYAAVADLSEIDVPYTPRNYKYLTQLLKDGERHLELFLHYSDYIKLVWVEEGQVVSKRFAELSGTSSVGDTRSALLEFAAYQQKSADTLTVEQLAGYASEMRALCRFVESVTEFDYDPWGTAWEYQSPMGFSIPFSGRWELGDRLNKDARRQIERETRELGFCPDEIFANWTDHIPPHQAPDVALFTSVHPTRSDIDGLIADLRSQPPNKDYANASVFTVDVGGRRAGARRETFKDASHALLTVHVPGADRTFRFRFRYRGPDLNRSYERCLEILKAIRIDENASQRPLPRPPISRGNAFYRTPEGIWIRPPEGFEFLPEELSRETTPFMPARVRALVRAVSASPSTSFVRSRGNDGSGWGSGDSVVVQPPSNDGLDFESDLDAIKAAIAAEFRSKNIQGTIETIEREPTRAGAAIRMEGSIVMAGGRFANCQYVIKSGPTSDAIVTITCAEERRAGLRDRARAIVDTVAFDRAPPQTPAETAELRRRAQAGEGLAMVFLARSLEASPSDPSAAEAVKWYEKAAQSADPLAIAEACFSLGTLHEEARIVPQDHRLAQSWLRKAVNAGNGRAARPLGVLLEEGKGSDPNVEGALTLYGRAAGAGDVEAMRRLGIAYLTGKGVTTDLEFAEILLRAAASRGDAEAMFRIAQMYRDGTRAPADLAQATEWFAKAAEKGHPGAMCGLGLLHAYSRIPSADPKQGVAWVRKASEAGDVEAMTRWGHFLLVGYEGTPTDPEEAFYWQGRAANEGNGDAMLALGEAYEAGNGIRRNYDSARAWYEAARNHNKDRANAKLGWLYENGLGVPKDENRALEYYLKGAQEKDALSTQRLADCYRRGIGTEPNIYRAWYWYNEGFKLGDAASTLELATCYDQGRGAAVDPKKAADLYERAARSEDRAVAGNAARRLATLRLEGRGVSPDVPRQ